MNPKLWLSPEGEPLRPSLNKNILVFLAYAILWGWIPEGEAGLTDRRLFRLPTTQELILGGCLITVAMGGAAHEIINGGYLEPSPLERLKKKIEANKVPVKSPIPVTFVKMKHPEKLALEVNDSVSETFKCQLELLVALMDSIAKKQSFRIFEEALFTPLDDSARTKFAAAVIDKEIQHAFDVMNNLSFDWEGNDFQFDYLDQRLGYSVRELYIHRLILGKFPNGIPRDIRNWDSAQIQALWLFGAPRILWSLGYLPTLLPADDVDSYKQAYTAIKRFRESPWNRRVRYEFEDARGAQREIALLARIATLPPFNGKTYIFLGSEHNFKRYQSVFFDVETLDKIPPR